MNRSPNGTIRHFLFAIAAPILAVAWQPALAASECKGLAQDVCVTNENCRWMDGYTRKDGIQVSSHCRLSKPRKKDAAEVQAKADTKTETVTAEVKPETVEADSKPEAVSADVKPETMKADAKPETVAADVKPEAATTDTPTETN
jgi:hypothetical protein